MLNNAGQTGPVTINVRDGVYNEQFLSSNIQGNSFVNTLTIQGESGDSSLVRLRDDKQYYNLVLIFVLKGLTLRRYDF